MVDFGQSQCAARRTIVSALIALLLVHTARAEEVSLDPTRAPRIVNGLATHDYPTTGALLYSQGGAITPDNATSWCSGTLIGCSTFLVAAHCVIDDTLADHYLVYLQHAGLSAVASITPHPSYRSATFPKYDVAVLKLGAWVTGIAPTAINQTDPAPFIPAQATIVGFGESTGNANDYGLKRFGAVQTEDCPLGLPANATNADVLCWDFTSPVGPPGTDSNTCFGDSGGPLFLDLGAGPVVAATTSGGTSADCEPVDHGYDANVFTHRAFILGQLGSDSTAACGGLAPIGDAQTAVYAFDGTLSGSHGSDAYTVNVPAGANALRVTLNGKDDEIFDANLYVKQGLGASVSSYDCKADGTSVFGACTFDVPAAGTWSVAVDRARGSGEYQLTATVFGGAAPVCGNNIREFDEDCDGTDDAACPGQCDASCQCAVTCALDALTDIRARLNALHFRLRGVLQNLDGRFDGADPRQGFALTLSQGSNAVHVSIPANDSGWQRSKPATGRYLWSGDLSGIEHVKAIDRTASTGTWGIVATFRALPGAAGLDVTQPLHPALTIGAACTTSP
jgi:Trypsin/Bacterial pre-peptidase C-terminal domain